MARGGQTTIHVDYKGVESKLLIALSRVERGTKKATEAACKEIMRMSLEQVPRDTDTLANSFDYTVHGNRKNFTAVIGYGLKGNPINPKTKQPASKYMIAVHEDLSAKHPVGKAKFLEDPVREYQTKHLARTANILRRYVGI